MDASAFDRAGETLAKAFALLLLLSPLGVWKLVEIIVWAWRHVEVSIR